MPDAPGPPVLDTRLVPPPSSWDTLAAAQPPGPRFTVGGVLARTMRVWWSRVAVFTAMSIVVHAPMIVALGVFFARLTAAVEGRPAPEGSVWAKAVGGFVTGGLVTAVLSVVQVGAVTYATVRHLHGERAPVGRMLAVGLRRGLPVVGTGLVVSIVAVAGMFLLFVPGVLFMVAACVAVPAAVVERPGVAGALRRSFDLTRGYRWPLFAAGAVVVVVLYVLSLVTQVAFTLAAVAMPGAHSMAVSMVGGQLGNALFSVIPAVAVAVSYHDLRLAKEGVDTAELAKVFE